MYIYIYIYIYTYIYEYIYIYIYIYIYKYHILLVSSPRWPEMLDLYSPTPTSPRFVI
jgi:hypothetical protein